LETPELLFQEAYRVLRPGGVLAVKTPNKNNYVGCVARLTSHGFHSWYNRLRGRKEEDTFPTCYRANTPRRLKQLFEQAGFEGVTITPIEGRPEYMRLNAFTYILGWCYERIVNSTDKLAMFRIVLIGVARKPI